MSTVRPEIIYSSQPTPVKMADAWYDIASLDHFWIRRRFQVLRKLADPLIRGAAEIGEIGCGNGMVQRCIEDTYGVPVTGFELNELALQKSIARKSPLYYYDIHQRNQEFHQRFDLLVMFDVIEHIADETAFLQSALFHLKDSGAIVINVPAFPHLFSEYDRAAGHFRRYTIPSFRRAAQQAGVAVRALTYWGAPLWPLLVVRKGVMKFRHGEGNVVASGWDPGSPLVNGLLGRLSHCEILPQRLIGTSLMAVVTKSG
jgi:SAM-dependent methyltransferase